MSDEKLLAHLERTDLIRKQRKKGTRLCTACDNLEAFEEMATGTINRPIQNVHPKNTTKICIGGLLKPITEDDLRTLFNSPGRKLTRFDSVQIKKIMILPKPGKTQVVLSLPFISAWLLRKP